MGSRAGAATGATPGIPQFVASDYSWVVRWYDAGMRQSELRECPGSGGPAESSKPLRRAHREYVDQVRCPQCSHFFPRGITEQQADVVPVHAL